MATNLIFFHRFILTDFCFNFQLRSCFVPWVGILIVLDWQSNCRFNFSIKVTTESSSLGEEDSKKFNSYWPLHRNCDWPQFPKKATTIAWSHRSNSFFSVISGVFFFFNISIILKTTVLCSNVWLKMRSIWSLHQNCGSLKTPIGDISFHLYRSANSVSSVTTASVSSTKLWTASCALVEEDWNRNLLACTLASRKCCSQNSEKCSWIWCLWLFKDIFLLNSRRSFL